MKKLLLAVALIVFFTFLVIPAYAGDWVRVDGYYRSDGTYVEGHYRTRPNNTVTDNFNYPGNYNPNKGYKKIKPGRSSAPAGGYPWKKRKRRKSLLE